jgi:hypothetical protein
MPERQEQRDRIMIGSHRSMYNISHSRQHSANHGGEQKRIVGAVGGGGGISVICTRRSVVRDTNCTEWARAALMGINKLLEPSRNLPQPTSRAGISLLSGQLTLS